jgi:hypothetical protein
MATKQTASKAETPAAVKAAATRKARAPSATPKVVEGPKGLPMPEPEAQHAIPEEQRQAERRQAQTNAIAQFTASQMQTPAVHEPGLTEEERKRIAFEEQVKVLASQMGVDPAQFLNLAPGKVKTPRVERQQKNGLTRPAAGTTTGKIWDLADKLSADNNGTPVAIGTLRQHPDMRQVNDHTLKTQFARWRTYHGIKGRAPAQPEPAPQPNRRATDAQPG